MEDAKDKRVASSANRLDSDVLIERGKSFIKILKRRGPRMEPCGTPYLIGSNVDLLDFIHTDCVLLDRYDFS